MTAVLRRVAQNPWMNGIETMKTKVTAGLLVLAATALWATSPAAMQLGVWKGKIERSDAPIILAQASDAEMQVQQLQEQVRQLNGKIEDMGFQILQMQETLRKAQEDNEFRFQELEGGKGKKKSSNETLPGDRTNDTANASGETAPGADAGDGDNAALDQPMDNSGDQVGQTIDSNKETGKPPVDLGSLKFDQKGDMLGANPADPNSVQESNLPPPDTNTDSQTASVDPTTSDPAYQSAYEQMLAGEYASAESGFAQFIQAHPESKRMADAHFWLGEAQYSQGKFNDAAKTFLDGYKAYGKSAKAPEMLLKLAMSLAKLDSKDTACATLREVSKAYPKSSRAIINKVASEQKRLAC
jgi:tol-pal system protein YbgF